MDIVDEVLGTVSRKTRRRLHLPEYPLAKAGHKRYGGYTESMPFLCSPTVTDVPRFRLGIADFVALMFYDQTRKSPI